MQEEKAIQDYHQGNCFGCGAANEHGLQIKSYPENGKVVCDWTPEPYHHAGVGVMYGGIIASLLDCHMGTAAMHHIMKEDGNEREEGYPNFNTLTANLNVDYLGPTHMDTVHLEAWVNKIEGKKVFVEATLSCDGTMTARAKGLFIKVFQ